MGIPHFPLLDKPFEEMINGSILNNALVAQGKRKRRVFNKKSVHISFNKSVRRVPMKRQARLGLKSNANGIEKRVRILKNLIPNSESIGLDGLFRETADYILSLQMRVRIIQNMVKVFMGSAQE